MASFWISVLLLIVGALIVEAVRFGAEYVKRITPRIEYQVSSGIPVKVDDRYFCGYEIKISNPSKKKVEEVTFHLRNRNNNLTLEIISKPDGFEFTSVDKEGGIDLSFPRLKQGETVLVKVQTENKYLFSDSLGISVSSPNDIENKRIAEANASKVSVFKTLSVFIYGSAFGVVTILIITLINTNRTGQRPMAFEMDRRDVVISAASVAGLPKIAELYMTAPEPKYFNEGDIAYSLAVESNKPGEIDRYRRLLSITLETAPDMTPESQANLFYSLGKLDLLLSDENSAVSDFRNAIAKSHSIVETQAKGDTNTHKYLIERGLL